MGAVTSQAKGAVLLALILCGQIATAAAGGSGGGHGHGGSSSGGGASTNPGYGSQYVSSSSALSRTMVVHHIALLQSLEGLATKGKHWSPAGGARPRGAPGVPGGLAAGLQQLYGSFNWSASPPQASAPGWYPVGDAAQAAAARQQALSMANYYAQPSTIALLRANPSVVPAALRGPQGMTRRQACQEMRRMGLCDKVKRAACDAAHPWVSAEAAAGLELEGFFETTSPAIGRQLANWHAGVAHRPSWPSMNTCPRAPYKYHGGHGFKQRRNLLVQCDTSDSLLSILLGDGRDYFCFGIDCAFQISELPIYFTLGAQGCAGTLKVVADNLFFCLQNGCNAVNFSDPLVVANTAVSLASQFKIDVHAGVCLGLDGLQKVLKKLGLSVCLGPTFTLYPMVYQFQMTLGVSILIAGLEFGGRVQLADGSKNEFCAVGQRTNPLVYNKMLKCLDYCAWRRGNGALELGAWLNILIIRKTWSYKIVQSPVPDCDP